LSLEGLFRARQLRGRRRRCSRPAPDSQRCWGRPRADVRHRRHRGGGSGSRGGGLPAAAQARL